MRAFNLLAASSKCCSGMLNITCVLLNWLLILLSEWLAWGAWLLWFVNSFHRQLAEWHHWSWWRRCGALCCWIEAESSPDNDWSLRSWWRWSAWTKITSGQTSLRHLRWSWDQWQTNQSFIERLLARWTIPFVAALWISWSSIPDTGLRSSQLCRGTSVTWVWRFSIHWMDRWNIAENFLSSSSWIQTLPRQSGDNIKTTFALREGQI